MKNKKYLLELPKILWLVSVILWIIFISNGMVTETWIAIGFMWFFLFCHFIIGKILKL